MTIEKIREKLAINIGSDLQWIDLLNDTNPGHYGVEDWEVEVSEDDIWVDIPKRTFKFKNAQFNFTLLLGSSNDGLKDSFSEVCDGTGTFSFTENGVDIEIGEMEFEIDLDIYREK